MTLLSLPSKREGRMEVRRKIQEKAYTKDTIWRLEVSHDAAAGRVLRGSRTPSARPCS